MPTVRMRRQISGTRHGVPWPAPGGTIDVSESDAKVLVRHRHAVVVEPPKPKRAPRKQTQTAASTQVAED